MTKLTRKQVEQIIKKASQKGERPDLSQANLSGVNLNGMDFNGANLNGADFRGADFSGVNFSGASLSETDLSGANLSGMDLNGANLSGANLRWANLSKVDLFEANLSGADLLRANLSWVDLRWANLRWANFKWANLRWTDLNRADLIGADFSEADLIGADLSGANLSGANLSEAVIGWTVFGDVDLSVVKGLEDVRHYGPSEIGISVVYKSNGNIPEVFLRGCGIPEEFITYMPSLSEKIFESYSCFISYSHPNEAFAQHLYADLQSNGMRCWYAPEDMKTGRKIRHIIDRSIRLHDKLLLILSEQSVVSEWVEHEVEHALELERERNEVVLFPIRLDGAALESNARWAGNIRRGRHIGDFTQWQDVDAYQKSFDRLLRDLKAGDKKS